MPVTAKEKREIEKYVKSLYDNVISVKIEEDNDNPAELTLKVTRGVVLPPIKYSRKDDSDKSKPKRKK